MTIESVFEGHGFHHSFDKDRASGSLTLSDAHVRFENAQASVRFPLQGAQFSLGGASNRLVFISHPSEPDWNLYTSDLRILNHPALQQYSHLSKQVRGMRNTRRMGWGILASIAALIVVIPLLVVFFMGSLTAPLARHVPPEWEQQLGETAFAQYRIGQDFLDQQESDPLLDPLVNPLLEELEDARYPFEFYVSSDEAVNAFALPGGIVVINSGLILKADSPEELLGVVAHEISHVTEQHSIRNIMSTAGVYLTVNAVLGDMSGLLAMVANAAPYLINQRYSRRFETDADEKGLDLLNRAGINPDGLVTFFEKLREQEQEKLKEMTGEDREEMERALESTLQILSTHPATQDRIDHLEKLIEQQSEGRYRHFDDEFEALQARVKRFVAHEGDDTTRKTDP